MIKNRNILLLGASGSVGSQALEIIKKNKSFFKITGASVGNNTKIVESLIQDFEVSNIFVLKKEDKLILKNKFPKINFYCSEDNINKFIKKCNYDFAINAISGIAGLEPTLTIIGQGKTLALANKESLVVGGHLIMKKLRSSKSHLMTVDSEHSAIWQILQKSTLDDINFVILTASGGPFLNTPRSELENIDVDQALNHPTWKMGKKISVDSATMMNKVFEVYEAKWLFNLKKDQIKAVIEPNSFVHGGVQFKDGSMQWQLSKPTMILPIKYAMFYPERTKDQELKPLSIDDFNKLKFIKLTQEKFPLFFLGTSYLDKPLSWPVVINAANEVAVDLFLNKKIKFLDIEKVIQFSLDNHEALDKPNLKDIIRIDNKVRKEIMNKYGG